jgi:integration host factor subunit alpha
MTCTKAEIAEGLQKELSLTKLVAKEIVDQVFEVIRVNLETGHSAKLSSFGNFELKQGNQKPLKPAELLPLKQDKNSKRK